MPPWLTRRFRSSCRNQCGRWLTRVLLPAFTKSSWVSHRLATNFQLRKIWLMVCGPMLNCSVSAFIVPQKLFGDCLCFYFALFLRPHSLRKSWRQDQQHGCPDGHLCRAFLLGQALAGQAKQAQADIDLQVTGPLITRIDLFH